MSEDGKKSKMEMVIHKLDDNLQRILPMLFLANKDMDFKTLFILLIPILLMPLEMIPAFLYWVYVSIQGKPKTSLPPTKNTRIVIEQCHKNADGIKIASMNDMYMICCDTFARQHMDIFKDVVTTKGSSSNVLLLPEYDFNEILPLFELDYFPDRMFKIKFEDDTEESEFWIRHEQYNDDFSSDSEKKQVRKMQRLAIEAKTGKMIMRLLDYCQKCYVVHHYLKNTSPFTLSEITLSLTSGRSLHHQLLGGDLIGVNKRFANIYLSEENEIKICNRIQQFMSQKGKDDSLRLGIPRKLAFLLHGKPGNGKTSVIYAIANECQKKIVNIDLACIKTNEELRRVCSCITNAVVKFDDIDNHEVVRSRDLIMQNRMDEEKRLRERMERIRSRYKKHSEFQEDNDLLNDDTVDEPDDKDADVDDKKKKAADAELKRALNTYKRLKSKVTEIKEGVTLDCFLEILDGYKYFNECIILMTTNHPELLDEAVVRPGRMDDPICFKMCDKYQFVKMMTYIFEDPGLTKRASSFDFPEDTYTTSCMLNTIILPNRDNVDKIFTMIDSEKDAYKDQLYKQQVLKEYLDQAPIETYSPPPVTYYGPFGTTLG